MPTDLTELHPAWLGRLRPESGEGIEFDCPACGPKHRIACYFVNPVDGLAPMPNQRDWLRTGMVFSRLSITPSISHPCWHGWLEDGKAIRMEEGPGAIVQMKNGEATVVVWLSPDQLARFVKESQADPLEQLAATMAKRA